MAPPTKVPDKNTLQRWQEAGLTAQEMADLTLQRTGMSVSRSAIAQALSRYGLAKERTRYIETVPWDVNKLHATARPLRMLRLLGRRRNSMDLTDEEAKSLDNWLTTLAEHRAIVAYDPDDLARGFHYVNERWRDHKDKTLPIRRRRIHIDPARHAGSQPA